MGICEEKLNLHRLQRNLITKADVETERQSQKSPICYLGNVTLSFKK